MSSWIGYLRAATLASMVLASWLSAKAQSSKPDALKQTLATVADTYGFAPSKSGPFHLKAHFDTFGADGKPDGSGTLDEYGDGKQRLRRVLTYRGQTQTVWLTPALAVSGGDFHAPFFVRRLIAGFEHPLPPVRVLDDRTFEDKQEKFGATPMHCIVTRRKPQPGHSQPEGAGPFGPADGDAYCLSMDDRYLRVEQSFPALTLVYNNLRKFNGLVVPFALTLNQGSVVRGEFHADELEATLPDDATFVPTADAKAGPDVIDNRDIVQLPGKVAETNNISKRPPSYPPIAKQAHVTGMVIMGAIISKQGTVSDLEVINGANPMLIPAAMEAAREWRYKPLLLNGTPVEVDTTITINFAFGVGPMIPGIR